MRAAAASLLVLLATATAAAVEHSGLQNQIVVPLPRLEDAIVVDGVLEEPVWRQAATLTGFSQYAPDDGRAAEDRTDVLVWYSETAIHFGVRAHAVPGSVRATLADRDRID